MRFSLEFAMADVNWTYLLIAISALATFSLVLSFLKIKNFDFQRILLYLNILFLFSIIYYSLNTFISIKKEIFRREKEYISKAKQDMQNDNVTFIFASGLIIESDNQITFDKTNRIHKKYGIKYINTGCIIDLLDMEARQKYNQTVAPYLEKRNGKNWESKMNAEIEKMRK